MDHLNSNLLRVQGRQVPRSSEVTDDDAVRTLKLKQLRNFHLHAVAVRNPASPQIPNKKGRMVVYCRLDHEGFMSSAVALPVKWYDHWQNILAVAPGYLLSKSLTSEAACHAYWRCRLQEWLPGCDSLASEG